MWPFFIGREGEAGRPLLRLTPQHGDTNRRAGSSRLQQTVAPHHFVRMQRTMCRRNRLVSSVLLVWLGMALPPAATASPAALIDAKEVGLRDDLAWLADRELISIGLSTWPIPRGVVSSAIDSRRAGTWSIADLDALSRIRATLTRLEATAVVSWQTNTARLPVSDAGLAVRARNEAALQVQHATQDMALRLRMGLQEQGLAQPAARTTLDGSYLALRLPGATLALGAIDRWWGPGRHADPVLSNAAPAIPALSIRRNLDTAPELPALAWIGPWSYEVSIGRPSHYRPRGPSTIGLRLSARPLSGLEIGISRYLYWGGEGRPHSLRSLADALLGLSNIDDPQTDGPDPSNEIAGVDLRWALPTANATWVGYAHLAGEDEADATPSKWMATLGLQFKYASANQRIEWTVEGTDTRLGNMFGLRNERRQPAYQHSTYTAGHYHRGLPVGAFIGGGGVLAGVGLAVVPTDSRFALRYEARLWRASVSQHGNEPINLAYGRPGRVDGLSLKTSGMTQNLRWHVGLAVQRHGDAGTSDGHRIGLIGGIEWQPPQP
jgi:hypothetical protein